MMSSDIENYFLLHMNNNPDRLTFSLGFILWKSLHNFPSPNCSFLLCSLSVWPFFYTLFGTCSFSMAVLWTHSFLTISEISSLCNNVHAN